MTRKQAPLESNVIKGALQFSNMSCTLKAIMLKFMENRYWESFKAVMRFNKHMHEIGQISLTQIEKDTA